MRVKAVAPGRGLEPGAGLCATFLWTFKEVSKSGGPPDLCGRSHRWRRSKNLKGKISSLPHQLKAKEKPAGLSRRLSLRHERGTEAPRPRVSMTVFLRAAIGKPA